MYRVCFSAQFWRTQCTDDTQSDELKKSPSQISSAQKHSFILFISSTQLVYLYVNFQSNIFLAIRMDYARYHALHQRLKRVRFTYSLCFVLLLLPENSQLPSQNVMEFEVICHFVFVKINYRNFVENAASSFFLYSFHQINTQQTEKCKQLKYRLFFFG